MEWLMENWVVIFGLIVAVIGVALIVYRFLNLPTEKQVTKIKEWLIWACIEAEKSLQSGTGQMKLRQVYDMFCSVPVFTSIAKIISFELFSKWVQDSLTTAKELLVKNEALAKYVYGDRADDEIAKLKSQLGI